MAKRSARRDLYAAAVASRKPPRNRGQAYVSQGRAVQNAANQRNTAQARADAERTASQAYYRHKLGYDKPGITPKGVKRAAKKAYHAINPWD